MHYGREASWHTAFVPGDYPAVQPSFILKRQQCYLLALGKPPFLPIPPAEIAMSLSAAPELTPDVLGFLLMQPTSLLYFHSFIVWLYCKILLCSCSCLVSVQR